MDIFLCVYNKLWKHFHTFTHLFDHSTRETLSLALLEFSFPFLPAPYVFSSDSRHGVIFFFCFLFSVFCILFRCPLSGFFCSWCCSTSTSPYFVGCCCGCCCLLFAQQFLIIDFHCSFPPPGLRGAGAYFFTLKPRNCYTWLQNFWSRRPLSLYGDL